MKNNMKKIVLLFPLIIISFALIIIACEDSKINEEKFYDMYKEILIIRKENEDTTTANPLVKELYKKYNYPQEQFKKDYFELAQNNKTFIKKVDSIRTIVNNSNNTVKNNPRKLNNPQK
jgi:hypothetical protein